MIASSRTIRYRLVRIFALLLALALAAALLPAGGLAADGEDDRPDSSTGIVKGYEWHRVCTGNDLPEKGTRCPVLILWKENNTIYYADGGYAREVEYDDDDWDAVDSGSWAVGSEGLPDPFSESYKDTMSFTTLDVMTTWEMSVPGKYDEDNGDCPRVRFYPNRYSLLTGYDDFDFPNKTTASDDCWTIYTSDKGGKYGKNISAGMVKIFCNVRWDDTGFMHSGRYLLGYCEDIWDYHTFAMYWGEERNFTAITDDYSVPAGQVMNVDDGVMLMDGKTLTVEPGGMLSIEGTFYNNGTIENRGTMILQENACVCCSPKVNSSAGRILCSGAEISMKTFANQRIAVNNAQIAELEQMIAPQTGELWRARKSAGGGVGLLADRIREAQAAADALADMKDRLDLKETEYTNDKAMYDAEKEAYDKDKPADKSAAEQVRQKLDEKKKALEQQKTEIEALRAEYKQKLEPHQRMLDEYYSYLSEYDRLDEQMNAASATIQWLKEENEQYRRVKDEPIQGDGNLILLKNSKLVLGDGDGSGFLIEDGASVTDNGFIISPHSITMDNAKLKICASGVLFCGYHFANGLTGVAQLQPKNEGGPSVTFAGLEQAKYYPGESAGVVQTGDYVFEVDGVFLATQNCSAVERFYEFGHYREEIATPKYGSGWWLEYVPFSD